MFRRAIISIAVVLWALCGFAQISQGIQLGHFGTNSKHAGSSVEAGKPSPHVGEQAISLARLRVSAKARKLYEKAIEPVRKRDYARAQELLNEALRQCSSFPEALTLLGYVELDLNQRESAEQNLQAALHSDPNYGPAYLVLSDLYNRERHYDDALAMSQRAIALIPDWSVQYELIRALIGQGEYALALNTSDDALRSSRESLLHVAKAHALIGLKRYPEAVAELRTYLDDEPAGVGSQDARDLLERIQSATVR